MGVKRERERIYIFTSGDIMINNSPITLSTNYNLLFMFNSLAMYGTADLANLSVLAWGT